VTPSLVTIPNVPLIGTGLEYQILTGEWTVTEEDLASIVSSQDDPAIISPRLKLSLGGEHGPMINEPAFGRADNLRLGDNGQTVYCDYVGVPVWLAEILPVAYPNRSVEVRPMETVTGHKWPKVVTAVELLGVCWPGCQVLPDLPLYYGDEIPADVEVAAAFSTLDGDEPLLPQGGRSVPKLNGRATSIAASVNVDDVRRDYYDSLNSDQSWWWIRAIYLDPNELIVDDDEGGLYRVPFTVNGTAITFGDAVQVKIEYVDVPAKAAASIAVAGMSAARGEEETQVIYASRAEARPDAEEETLTPQELRKSLGLAEDATDAEVEAKLAIARGGSAPGSEEPDPGDEEQEGVKDGEKPDEEPAPAAEPEAAVEPIAASSGRAVTVDKARLDQLEHDASLGVTARRAQVESEADTLIAAAVGDGRIAPASREAWRDAILPKGKTELVKTEVETLASLAAGRIPVDERGAAPNAEGADATTHEAIMASFGVERKVA
jgi:hypothetical protein